MKISEAHIQQIARILGKPPLVEFPLKNLTSYRVGGPADLVAFPEDTGSLIGLLCFVKEQNIRYFILGSGTNVLFSDEGFRGLIISPLKMKSFEIKTNSFGNTRIVAQSGTPLPRVVYHACRFGLTGMEPLWGIPGSVGGSIACNAGAGSVSVLDLVADIDLVTWNGERTLLKKDSFSYGYRSCNLPLHSVILQAAFELDNANLDDVQKKLADFKSLRQSTQPHGFPNAGCVFKNPSANMPAGALIEKLGFKSMKCGGAEVSSVHANFIVNTGKALAQDILKLIDDIIEASQKRAGINLELEIRIVKPSENYV